MNRSERAQRAFVFIYASGSVVDSSERAPAAGAPACISFATFMNFPVTLATQSDQVVFGIRALMAPESPVMNFDCGKRAAGLAPPPVPL